jgi:two-component system sensor histidine kinase KdpD
LKLDWTDINEIIHLVISKLEDKLANHQIVFEENELMPLVKLDSVLIEQVLYNLILNAILYTPNGTHIIIQTFVEDELFNIVVMDDGPGFPASALPNVFKMFYRLPHHKTGGSGLGLSIVKGFVEAHNGKVILESKEYNGAKFTIQLPVALSYIKNINNE